MLRRLSTFVVTLALLGTGCGDDDADGDDGADSGMESTGMESGGMDEISLEADGMPIIAMRCGGCHTRTNAPFPPAVVNMVYFEEKGDVLGLVGTFIQAGDSANSGLIAIMRQDMPVGMTPTLMPPPGMGPPMPTEEVDAIAAWIDQGAQDN